MESTASQNLTSPGPDLLGQRMDRAHLRVAPSPAPTPDCLCARCAAAKGSCCARREIYLTPGDRRRMVAFLKRDDFFGWRPTGDPDYLPDGTDPDWARYVFNGRGERPILLSVQDGTCGHLGPRGCLLPMEVRPLICRLYPWQYDHQGLTTLAGDCPRELLRPGETLLEQLGMADMDTVRRWHRMLYAEMREGEMREGDERSEPRSPPRAP